MNANILNALTFAKMSKAIYQDDKNDEPSVQVIFPLMQEADPSVQSVEIFKNENAVSAYVECQNYDVFVWRGTDDLRDALDDFNAGWRSKYHRGMLHHTLLTLSEMRKARHRVGHRLDRPLVFTGHSLGAACATIGAHIWYEDTGSTNFRVFTFGSPRCLRTGTKFPSDISISRFKHSNDVVPRVPPFFLGFKHVGKTYYIDHEDIVHQNVNICTMLIDHFKEYRRDGWCLTELVSDHSAYKYVNALQKNVDRNV